MKYIPKMTVLRQYSKTLPLVKSHQLSLLKISNIAPLLKTELKKFYHASPFGGLFLFFPLQRFALSLFLCLGFIHIGYCPCSSRRVFELLCLSMSILLSPGKKKS
uniref:Uncharacterized protein n=1 Tax=Anolis carolinensis TaxID=28377 RepID=A0A803STS8_ANOCA